jgi:glycosyltransferase involved in cell wall biosynthesis
VEPVEKLRSEGRFQAFPLTGSRLSPIIRSVYYAFQPWIKQGLFVSGRGLRTRDGAVLLAPDIRRAEKMLSACVICFNEEGNIARCLSSLDRVDEVVVVDSGSTDRTVEIARSFTNRIFHRDWTGYADQKNFAMSQARGDWILSVDADEEISPDLKQEIDRVLSSRPRDAGFKIPRRSFYQGRWINHSGFYPDRQLRLFRRDRARWVRLRVHERVDVDGTVGKLERDLLHYPYNGVISGQLKTVDAFSTLFAKDLRDQGAGFHLWLLLVRPIFKFLEVYVLKKGFLDGVPGLIIAVTSAYALFVRYVKVREMEKGIGH